MRRFLIVAGLMLLSGGIASAACNRFEVSGGYDFFRLNTSVTITTQPVGTGSGTSTTTNQSFNLNGWNAGAAVNATCWLGLVGDISGTYGTPVVSGNNITSHVYNYVFGPRINLRNSTRFTPFAEALFGASHQSLLSNSAGLNTSFNQFAMALGGGVDVGITKHVAIRGRGDYVLTDSHGVSQNNASVSAGLVWRFGGGG
jgi:opacity protein-like surface antigen